MTGSVREAGFRRALVALAVVHAGLAFGCSAYCGTAVPVQPKVISAQTGWISAPRVPLVRQQNAKDCGAAALTSVLNFWGRPLALQTVEDALHSSGDNAFRAGELEGYARQQGLSSFVFFGEFDDLVRELRDGRPVIVGMAKPYGDGKARTHYEVVVGYNETERRVLTIDPARGFAEYPLGGFLAEWTPVQKITLVVFPTTKSRG
jgi:ABC-type bacteriocin/lantibiotic exporter with double-glycine peptidase domain